MSTSTSATQNPFLSAAAPDSILSPYDIPIGFVNRVLYAYDTPLAEEQTGTQQFRAQYSSQSSNANPSEKQAIEVTEATSTGKTE